MSDRKPIKYIDSTSFGCVGDYVNKIEDDIYPQIRELEDENNKLKAILSEGEIKKRCITCVDFPGQSSDCDTCKFNDSYPISGHDDKWKDDPILKLLNGTKSIMISGDNEGRDGEWLKLDDVCCLIYDSYESGKASQHQPKQEKIINLLSECCDYLNGPGNGNYIGEGSRLHMEMEEARK